MRISIIVAMTDSRVIGKDNKLPWNLPEDLKRFRAITTGHPVIMGRKTFESIGKVLPKRRNIVISRQSELRISGAEVAGSLEAAIELCRAGGASEAFVIGGAEIYQQALVSADRLYLTVIHQSIEGDVYFPQWDMQRFKEVSREERSDVLPHTYLVLDRSKSSSGISLTRQESKIRK